MHKIQQGFTIIELVLVMAITGLVVAVILSGIGASLRAERYRDATSQTIDYFQGQYSAVANISNDRPAANICTTAGIAEDSGGAGRGTSDCLILGYVLRSNGGELIERRQVVARVDVSRDPSAFDDTEEQTLTSSSLVQSDESTQYRLDWGARLLRSGAPAQFSLLIVRAPLTGVIRTFASTSSSTTPLASLISSPVPTAGVAFCIDPSGVFDLGINPNGFVIDRNTSNSSGVRQLTAGAC